LSVNNSNYQSRPSGVYPLTTNNYKGGNSFGSFTDNSATMTIPNFGIALPISKKLTLGFAVYVPYGLSISFTNSPSNPISFSSYKSWYYREVFAFGAGYKITDNLFIGGAINIGTTQSGVQRYVWGTNFPKILGGLGQYAALKTNLADNHNFSWNLGLMYKPTDWLTLGATYRSMTHTNLSGTYQLQTPNGTQQGSTSTSVNAPDQLQIGVNIKPSEKVRFEVDYLWTDWSVVNAYDVFFTPALPLPSPANPQPYVRFPRHWNNTNTFKFGIEYKPIEMLALRGGFYYDPTPIPSSTFDAQWPDANKYMFTGGVGLNFKHWKIDTDVFYSTTAENRNISNSTNMNNSYSVPQYNINQYTDIDVKAHIWGYGLNVTYVF
jgi:long-chain fatty acid transport protein